MSSIVRLLHKDLLLMKRYIGVLAVYAIVFSGFIQANNSFLYGMLPGMVLILTLSADMQLPVQQFLVNLPVRRSLLVLSKYASAFIFMLAAFLLSVVLDKGAAVLQGGSVSWELSYLLGVFALQILVMSVYIPLYFWLGPKGAQFLNIAMMIFFFGVSFTVYNVLGSERAMGMIARIGAHPYVAGLMGICVAALAVFVSYKVSCLIFAKRDL
ncbi:ABC-2 transporter permease [Paenibacillus macerans]|uniref:ABC-2 transporter permease n=1 Tax=Paenibacillus macerans TaxID=44252 RepID=UPI002DB57D52|nr:ABC-2 transporter permease [Paenibacillus macerans]MEC0330941.1 ABC-2 transporter permease [Paenibacillus macerans]